jgi:hypothetical protein
MQASRRGIGWAPYTWGSISRDRLAPHTSRSRRGIGRAPYTWGSRLGARVGSAAVGIHPRGRPDAVPAKGVAGERVPSQVRRIVMRSGRHRARRCSPPALGLVNRGVVNAESTARLCGARGYWEQSQLLLLTWRWVDDLCVGQRQRKWSPCSCGNRPGAVVNGPRHR